MTTKAETLTLGPGLDLPLDFATEGLVVIGVRGSGKSNTEVRFAERLFAAGLPFVAIDPKGDWYGMRMDGPGSKGLPVPVFGGLFGDFPLDERLGSRIADLVVDTNMSAILDVSRMSFGARAKFLTAFFRQLMDRHQVEPHVRTVIFEEAHRYIPQVVKNNMTELKEAAASILLEGRSFGLGCWACTQRPARLHNDVLEEVDTALIFRLGVTATADLKRVREWVKHEDLGPEIGASLTKLGPGEAWVLSPVSLGIVARVQMDRRATFDSGATPVVAPGAAKRRQATMADIDAAAVKEALADAIEQAKEKDPVELRKRLAAAEARVRELEMWEPPLPPAPIVVEGLPAEMVDRLALHRDVVLEQASSFVESMRELVEVIGEAIAVDAEIVEPAPVELAIVPDPKPAPARAPAAPPAPRARVKDADDLPGGARKILDVAVASHPVRLTRSQLATFAGYSPKSSTWDGHISALRRGGFLLFEGKDVVVTDLGLATSDAAPSAPTSPAERLAMWTSKLKEGPAKILRVLVDAGAAGLTVAAVGEQTGYSTTSSTFDGHLATLRRNGLTTTTAGIVRASEDLYG